jgi:outer membrane autotransporter protein
VLAELAWSSVSTNRSIVFPGFSEVARARYNVGLAQVFGEVGYGVALGNIAAEPFAGLAYVHLHSGSFAESGGLAALSGANGDQDVGYSMLGARLATSWVLPNGPAVTPRVSAAWQHAFGDVTLSLAMTSRTHSRPRQHAPPVNGRGAPVVAVIGRPRRLRTAR